MLSLKSVGIRAAIAGCAAGSVTPALHGGQCEPVVVSSWGLAGTNDEIVSLGTWDPDGDGPLPDNLIVSGWFQQAGDLNANRIAMFDGQRWHRLGNGLGPDHTAHALAMVEFAGDLIVGGLFESAGDLPIRGVARWNGSDWSQLGDNPPSAIAIARHDGGLVACGAWHGRSPASTVLRWNGIEWLPFTPPISASGQLAVDSDGFLLVAGLLSFDGTAPAQRVARWDGVTWTQVGGDFAETIRTIVVHDGHIFVGGGNLATSPGGVTAGFLVRWDGLQWQPTAETFNRPVHSLIVHEGQLFASGRFSTIDGMPATGVARWDGAMWHALGQGLQFNTHASDRVGNSLATFRGALVVGGAFGQAGDVHVMNLAAWNGEWERLGGIIGPAGVAGWVHESSVYTIAEYDGDLVIAGDLNIVPGSRNIARLTPEGWIGLGSGLSFQVVSLCNTSHGLLAAGTGQSSFGVPSSHPVALWNGKTWEPLGIGQIRLDALVWCAIEYQGEMIIGGALSTASDLGAGNLRRWTGTEWVSVGPPTSATVQALLVHEGELIASGRYTGPNGEEILRIGRWNGTVWAPLGNANEIPMSVWSLAALGDDIFAAGSFDFGNDLITQVARFDGTVWHPIPRAFNQRVETVATFGGELFVGGWFGRVNGEWSPGIARWNPARNEWRAVRRGPDEPRNFAWRFHVIGDNLVAAMNCLDSTQDWLGDFIVTWTCAPPRPCPGDLNGNGDVDLVDLAVVLAHFGETTAPGGGNQIGDLDGDAAVTIVDLALLLRDFGARCE